MTLENTINEIDHIRLLLEKATDTEVLKKNYLEVVRRRKSNPDVLDLEEIDFIDSPMKQKCATISIRRRKDGVNWVTADLDAAYKLLTSNQQSLILANIYHYAADLMPSISFYFGNTTANESENVYAFGNFVRRTKPRLFNALESVFAETQTS